MTSSAPFVDRRTTPPGVLPRHLQLWALIGTAVVMVGIMSLSANRTPPRSASTSAASGISASAAVAGGSPASPVTDANQQRIEEFEQRINEQAQQLAGEKAELHFAKQALGVRSASDQPQGSAQAGSSGRTANDGTAANVNDTTSVSDTGNVNDALRQERLQRAYRSLFADNVAFSRGQSAPQQAQQQTARQLPQQQPATPIDSAPQITAPRTYRIPEGSIIETVLTNRLDGTFAGPVNCLVTTPVYADDRQHLLIPAGTRVLGDAVAVNTFGQSRLAVAFHRLLLADGRRIDLQSFHGLDQIGETGLRDMVNHHYAQIFGASLAIGAISGLVQPEIQGSIRLSSSPFDTSAHILDRFLNVLPTVTIREGHRIKIYLANDLDVPEYRGAIPPAGARQ